MDIITSSDNNVIKQARRLLEKKYRKEVGHFLLEGPKQISDAISGGFVFDKLFIEQNQEQKFADIVSKCDAQIYVTSKNVLDSLCDTQTPQGIVAELVLPVVKPYKYKSGDKLLILDRISDPGNMGTIIRTAKATGFEHIFAINCVDAYSPKVVRSSSGVILSSNVYPVDQDSIINYCKKHNIEILVADMNGQNVLDYQPSGDYAIVVGNEGHGVSEEFEKAGKAIRLPMKSGVESLNAGVSASVLMYVLNGRNI